MMTKAERFARLADTGDVRQNLRGSSVRGVVYLFVAGGGDFVLRLASTAVLARLLIPEHFGLIGMVTAITGIADQFSQLGLSTATVQQREIRHEQVTNLFWINVAMGAVLGLLVAFSAPLVAAYYRDPRLLLVTIAIGTSFLWRGVTVQHEALLTRQMKNSQAALIRLVATFLSTVLAVLLALGGYGYWALVWREVVRNFFVAVGVWIMCPWLPGLPDRRADISGFVRFGRDLTLVQLLNALVTNLDRLLIGRMFGAGAVGLYYQAKQLIVTPIEQLNGPIFSVSQPGLSILQDDPDRYRRYYQRIVHTIGLMTMPVAAFTAVYADVITLVIFGREWADAGVFLRIFAVSAFVQPVLGTSGLVLLTCGQSDRMLNFSLVRNSTLVVLTLIGLSAGPTGIALGQLSNTLILLFPCLYYSFAKAPATVSGFVSSVKTPALAAMLMAAGLIALRAASPLSNHIASLGWGFFVGVILYAGSNLLLPGGRSEMQTVVRDLSTMIPSTARNQRQSGNAPAA